MAGPRYTYASRSEAQPLIAFIRVYIYEGKTRKSFEEIVFKTNNGKEANSPRTITHRLSVANGRGGGLWNRPWFVDLTLQVIRRSAENDELHLNMHAPM
ncbi:hypothetical protein AVEN_258932-1 [Araneus ventricosus]|uniref:Uncharacterized protein n=1 Tax=Araneus ventricosus TaxID=182803 RepID=A0A4Y2CH30_ARAVE|nr:hypothetical protein AVEN_258932-1 [Araneus ventricosus]